jgi:hypothetical protein
MVQEADKLGWPGLLHLPFGGGSGLFGHYWPVIQNV